MLQGCKTPTTSDHSDVVTESSMPQSHYSLWLLYNHKKQGWSQRGSKMVASGHKVVLRSHWSCDHFGHKDVTATSPKNLLATKMVVQNSATFVLIARRWQGSGLFGSKGRKVVGKWSQTVVWLRLNTRRSDRIDRARVSRRGDPGFEPMVVSNQWLIKVTLVVSYPGALHY